MLEALLPLIAMLLITAKRTKKRLLKRGEDCLPLILHEQSLIFGMVLRLKTKAFWMQVKKCSILIKRGGLEYILEK